jgi:hypothetical protein
MSFIVDQPICAVEFGLYSKILKSAAEVANAGHLQSSEDAQ